MSLLKLAGLFFLTALLYAAVGFGGGSTYNAVLVLVGTDFVILPAIALICNIIVVTGGTWRFHRGGHIPWRKVWPLFAFSVPMAWIGGRILIDETLFVLLLGLALLFAGFLMLVQSRIYSDDSLPSERRLPISTIGGGLGFMSGMVGIGGGIFLAPILHLFNWERAKAIAGICSAFILVNSISGLIGQAMKLEDISRLSSLIDYWPLYLAVLVGGQIGSLVGSGWLNPRWIRVVTAGLILFVAARLLLRSAQVYGLF